MSSNAPLSWIDQLFFGVRRVRSDGTLENERPEINIIGATITDDPDNNRTNIDVSGGDPAAVGGLSVVTVTFDVDDDNFASLGAGVKTLTKTLGGTQANRVLAGVIVERGTAFTDGGAATYTIDVGWSITPNAFADAIDAAVSGVPVPGNGIVYVFGVDFGGLQINAKLTSSVDLNNAVAGSYVVRLYYFVPVAV